MASISRDKNGTKRLQWSNTDGKRSTIRLGKINVKAADRFLARFEQLLAAISTNTPIDLQTAEWISDLPDSTHQKLAKHGLVESRVKERAHNLGSMLEDYFEHIHLKQSTITRYTQTKRLLIGYFGQDSLLSDISARDADKWKSWLFQKDYASAKVARDVGIAKMFFRQAVRWEFIPSNPFDGIRAGSQTNKKKLVYLSPEDTKKLINAAPNSDWRCIIALARFGGLRCPSEVLRVRWADIDWDQNRFLVQSPKTEHHTGKGERIVPLFPELRSILMEAFELAPEGATRVVSGYPPTTPNLRTHLQRIIRRAGLKPWPRLFNAMRASRATELAAHYPAAICTAWMGHTRAVAEAHYHMVRDEDYERAAKTLITGHEDNSGAKCGAHVSQNASQQQAAGGSNKIQNDSKTEQGPALMPIPASSFHSLQNVSNGRNWTRTLPTEGAETPISEAGGAKCVALSTQSSDSDSQIRTLIRIWRSLDQKTRDTVIGIVEQSQHRNLRDSC